MRKRDVTALRHKLLPSTLFGRSLMILATPILLMQLIVGFIFFDRHWDAMSDKLVSALAGEVQMTAQRLADAHGQKPVDDIITEASTSLEMIVTVENAATPLIQPELPLQKYYWFGIADKLQSALDRKLRNPFIIRPYAKAKWFEIVVQIDPHRQAHFICRDKRLVSPTTYIFILWMIGSAVVLLGIAVIFMRNQIRPIMRLAVAAEKLGKGQDVPDFKPVGAREVRQASRAFLDMKERLKRQMEQRTAMLSGVSHDLRTPLTRMKLQLAMAKDTPDIENLRQDIAEMERMIEGYLTFARGENDEAAVMTDMRPLLERIVARARRQQGEIQETIEGAMMLRVRPMAVERAVGNIVSNACKYAKHVWLTAHTHENTLEIMVDDDGPGVPQALREEVFKPFYRVEKSRNKKTGGVGLGLSIAQDIIHSHGGEIFMEDSNRGGVRVVMRLPF